MTEKGLISTGCQVIKIFCRVKLRKKIECFPFRWKDLKIYLKQVDCTSLQSLAEIVLEC